MLVDRESNQSRTFVDNFPTSIYDLVSSILRSERGMRMDRDMSAARIACVQNLTVRGDTFEIVAGTRCFMLEMILICATAW